MFSELFDAIRAGFGICITIGIVIIVLAAIKGISDAKAQAESDRIEKEENRKLINTVISEARQSPTDVVIAQRDEVARVYRELAACRREGSLKIKEFAYIKVGDEFMVTLDFHTSYTILKHLNDEIARRNGK